MFIRVYTKVEAGLQLADLCLSARDERKMSRQQAIEARVLAEMGRMEEGRASRQMSFPGARMAKERDRLWLDGWLSRGTTRGSSSPDKKTPDCWKMHRRSQWRAS